jgi:hypothetical protein
MIETTAEKKLDARVCVTSAKDRCPQGLRANAARIRRQPPEYAKKGDTVSNPDLPPYIVARIERRWAQKLQDQVETWKSAKSTFRSESTKTGIPVVRRSTRSRSLRHRPEPA